ncbi:MAG: stage V sporulation T C-terminal domain-containing protein [Eubacteriales bacterium]|nr:stage V sporulation T C-terminal domain-containing protein [Eubacteriales bacterium]
MRATGIVRRIDDLGRVVIPKEIRRTMRIREGEPLEIYTDKDGEVIFKKYSPLGEISTFSAKYADALNKAAGIPVAVCDRDTVVAVAGINGREYLEKPISGSISSALEKRQSFTAAEAGTGIELTEHGTGRVSYLTPIISDGDVIGGIMLLAREGCTPDESERKMINTGALFLSKQLEL